MNIDIIIKNIWTDERRKARDTSPVLGSASHVVLRQMRFILYAKPEVRAFKLGVVKEH